MPRSKAYDYQGSDVPNTERETTYIAFLRGINVGGHIVKMEYLRQLFTDLGLKNVRSYIQSGNVFFDTADISDWAALTLRIENYLRQTLGYVVPVFLRTAQEVKRATHHT